MANRTAGADAPQRQAYELNEFCKAHGISRPFSYKEIAAGHLKTMKVGRKRMVSAQAAADWRKLCEDRAAKELGR